MRLTALIFVAAAALAQNAQIRLVPVVSGVASPTDIQNAGDGSGRLFVAQQNGVIRVVREATLLPEPFLDIRARTVGSGERGLLGLAFPPGFEQKRHFYVNYTDRQGNTVVARYRVSAGDPDAADAAREEVILQQAQPFANHNGGQIRFGRDGYLYIALGDGGSGGDPRRNGQNRMSWLGKLLRIDVESGAAPYRVPADNPFVNDASWLPEIWASGLRNPWRFSFDHQTGDLWIGDVGQDRAEEVNFTPGSSRGGENYGWNLMEGLLCFQAGCNVQGLALPVLEYSTRNLMDRSVTGGLVYRGSRWPSLSGLYFYGDYVSGRIWALRRDGDRFTNQFLMSVGFPISTFGEDQAGELYVADHRGGAIHRIEGTDPQPPPPRPAITAVVNAASNEPGVVAGSAATVYVRGVTDSPGVVAAGALPLPLALAGVEVTVNGLRAPLYAVANTNGIEQVNFQVPFEVAGQQASIVVSRNGESSAAVTASLLPLQPGVFTSNGQDAIVVHHTDNSLMSATRPLRRGSFAYFYATGLGEVDNRTATGAAAPRSPLAVAQNTVTVTIGSVPCEVLFAGLAPDLAGAYQVNFRVADGIGSGPRNLEVRAGSAAAPPVQVLIE